PLLLGEHALRSILQAPQGKAPIACAHLRDRLIAQQQVGVRSCDRLGHDLILLPGTDDPAADARHAALSLVNRLDRLTCRVPSGAVGELAMRGREGTHLADADAEAEL